MRCKCISSKLTVPLFPVVAVQAMVSVLGFAVQGYVTGEGPYANWSKHVADPFGYNLLTVSIIKLSMPCA
jgi:hypothetical protein